MSHEWKPIAPLTEAEKIIDLAAMRPLYEAWQAAKADLILSRPESFRRFTAQLVRRLSIETGILERLYDLDRGTTEALVSNGFLEELVSRSSTDLEPSHLIDILRDQEAAVQLVMDCVGGQRELTKSLIHELHEILTRHQKTTAAIDQFGQRLNIPLLKGSYKKQPNNPQRPDGSIHEYCPPIHVDSEMDQLLRQLSEYAAEDPVIVAAWFHHRFTQIHPYQDGNGRVGRAVTTLILLQADLLPLVIDRDIRVKYIRALEEADSGDLSSLAKLFASLERTAILQALSIDIDKQEFRDRSISQAAIESLAAKLERRKGNDNSKLRKVNELARSLRTRSHRVVEGSFHALAERLSTVSRPELFVADGGPDFDNAYWYKHEVVQSGKESGRFVNFNEDHYFVKATIRIATERLIFVTSFHHVGRELSGIMEVTAFALLESRADAEDGDRPAREFVACSLEPFVIAWRTLEEAIGEAFDEWLDLALAIAIKEYGDRL